MVHNMLYIEHEIEPFLSSFGSWCIPQPHGDGWIIPSDQYWKEELTQRGIEFKVIEIEENESRDL